MKKMMSLLALVAVVGTANAQQIIRAGTYESDAFIYSVDGSAGTGYVNVKWSGYATPSYGNVGWRVVVWDSSSPQSPVASETYHASGNEGTYARTFEVNPYSRIRVELYAVGDQYANSSRLSSTVTTSMWVEPTQSPVGTSYAYPTAYPTNSVYDLTYQSPPIVTSGFPVSYVPAPIYPTYPTLIGNGLYVYRH